MSLPIVAIVGRPNVGKSSLFNRLLRLRLAIVDPTPGVTRDRNYANCDWQGRGFRLVDTGGILPKSDEMMAKLISDQATFAIHEADVILFVVDSHDGVHPDDQILARQLHKTNKPVLLVANKADNEAQSYDRFEFLKLGLEEPMAVSATVGLGIGELLDKVVELIPTEETSTTEESRIRVAVVGRPNVGKSSFINKLLGEERHLVSEIAGTTRDAVDSMLKYKDKTFVLVDTAGLRRKYKVEENIEFYTSLRTTKAIENSDIALILIDAVDGVTNQDQRVLTQVLEARKAAVLVVNKWDLIEKDSKTADAYTKTINDTLAKHSFLPIIYISALTGQRVSKVLDRVLEVHEQHNRRIPTAALNAFLDKAQGMRKPPAREGKFIQIKYVTQTEIAPPTFVFFANHAKLMDKGYIQYLSNQLREEFGFEGVPIRIRFRYK